MSRVSLSLTLFLLPILRILMPMVFVLSAAGIRHFTQDFDALPRESNVYANRRSLRSGSRDFCFSFKNKKTLDTTYRVSRVALINSLM